MSDGTISQKEMPRYECHKVVHALKISAIEREDDGSASITPSDHGYAPFCVDSDYMQRHSPEAGGFYVVYADGYKSWSPAEAFEDGYTLIED